MSESAQLHGSDELGWLADMAQHGPVTTGDGGVLNASACDRAKTRLLRERSEREAMRAALFRAARACPGVYVADGVSNRFLAGVGEEVAAVLERSDVAAALRERDTARAELAKANTTIARLRQQTPADSLGFKHPEFEP